MRTTKKFRDSLKRNIKNTTLTSEIPAQYLVRLPIQTYARQYRLGSETCKTPGWAKMLMKSSPSQTESIWRSSLILWIYGHQSSGTTPLLSADGTSLLTDKKLSWKDGLNTLMVSLIGHHLSMMTLSTDYHRWNVIRCLMSSKSSLKQWKQ